MSLSTSYFTTQKLSIRDRGRWRVLRFRGEFLQRGSHLPRQAMAGHVGLSPRAGDRRPLSRPIRMPRGRASERSFMSFF